MQIWDTAGQESYKSVTRIFYRGAHCVFLTYDITRDETFNNLAEWHKEVKQHAAEDVMVYLVGNKAELDDQREVTFDRAVEWAQANGIHKCFETSAKTGKAVEEVFSCGGKDIFAKLMREMKDQDATSSIGSNTPITRRNSVTQLGNNGGVQKKDGCGC